MRKPNKIQINLAKPINTGSINKDHLYLNTSSKKLGKIYKNNTTLKTP